METKECGFSGFKMNGFLALFLHLVVLTAVIIFGFIISVPTLILSVCLCLIWFIMFAGYMELEPNEARAMVFFGKYKGTFKETGFFWVNPFLNKKKLSLRARNLDVEPIKVNDKIGNPILIGLVLVWKLKDKPCLRLIHKQWLHPLRQRVMRTRSVLAMRWPTV